MGRRSEDVLRRVRAGTARAMRRLAAARACPRCHRGNAVKVTRIDCGDEVTLRHRRCRYCGWDSDRADR